MRRLIGVIESILMALLVMAASVCLGLALIVIVAYVMGLAP